MQINKFLLTGVLCALVFSIKSQAQNLSGFVKSNRGESVPAATVRLQNSSLWTISDHDGHYRIKNIKPDTYILMIKAIGFKTQEKEVSIESGKETTLNVTLSESTEQMETVTVTGRTIAQETNRQAFNVTAVDARKLYNTTLDISSALDRVAGVRVRESGGVGSNFNLSLNGFSGNHIRYFIDGIPMDNFGSSFQINNIPINVADRVEVYKGVVPMWLGSDALGGAVNIVTSDRYRNYVDASYSYGSFNTHRSVVNAAVTSENGFTVQLNAFQNYSDNDYKVKVEAWDIYTGAFSPAARLRRFHDTYHNETLIANIGVVDKPYADKLLLGITLGQNYKEIQTGARMEAVFGGRHRRGNIIMPSLKYKKTNIAKGLDLTINANYNLGTERNIDTLNGNFDWYGSFKPLGANGESGRTLSKYKNNNGLATAMLNYRISETQSIALSNVFSTFNRKGRDAANPANDAFQGKKKTDKNVLGLGYSIDIRDKWSATIFGKYIYQNSINEGKTAGNSTMNKIGYGTAVTYFVTPNLQLKSSYELTNRMPEANEIFGDVENQTANPGLRPEKSNNLNLGAGYGFSVNSNNNFYVAAGAVYRRSDDFIYNRLDINQARLIADNREGVSTWGGDAEVRYSYKDWLLAGTTVTYQFLRNLQKYEPEYTGVSPLYRDQMPNIPYFFGNGDVSVSLKNVGRKNNNLTIGYNLLYVHAFWLYWPSRGAKDADAEKREVAQQLSHDVNFVYSLAGGRYNVALECKNLTNADLYDNFSLQKPGRAFYLNLRYFFNKNNHN